MEKLEENSFKSKLSSSENRLLQSQLFINSMNNDIQNLSNQNASPDILCTAKSLLAQSGKNEEEGQLPIYEQKANPRPPMRIVDASLEPAKDIASCS